MRFQVRLAISNRLGKGSTYSLRDICVCLVETYSLKEKEIEQIATLTVGSVFANEDMQIKRIK